MKIKTGRYNEQISFGVTITNYHGEYRALVFEFGIWYVEFVFKNYKD